MSVIPLFADPSAAPGSGPGAWRPEHPAQAAAYIDYAVVRRLRRQVAERLRKAVTDNPKLTVADQQHQGMALISGELSVWATAVAGERGMPVSQGEYEAYATAIFDLQFRHGRLQPYLDDPGVENILINGFREVWIDYRDRPRQQVPPIADSNEELVEFLQHLARRHGQGERSLSTASPMLALRLEDGSRLQALTLVTPEPYVVVRRHLVKDMGLEDMIGLGTIDATLASFLQALVKARKNVLVCGDQGAGKTSLLRAMAREIPRDERIGTLETEYELWLHELGVHTQIVPMEARQANGERVGEKADGSISIGDLIPAALRMTLSRMIVGEVRSDEIVYMLRVMTSGTGGSMSTMHVRKPHMIWDRIAELCNDSGVPDHLAYRLAANAIDFVVFVALLDETQIGGGRHRFVSHILEVMPGEGDRPATNVVFGPLDDDPRAVPHLKPICAPDLMRVGFDLRLLDRPRGAWRGPLDTMVRSW